MDVRVDDWNGSPLNLTGVLTPVKVEMNNEGAHPISLRYRDFHISNPNGVRSSALPPFRIHGSVTSPVQPVIVPEFAYYNFLVYPGYGFYGPVFSYWTDNWGWDGGWYGTYYGDWQQNLPSEDMLRWAIPEGVLNSNGRLSGYLYFQKVPRDAQSLEFTANLVDAKTHKTVGTIRIPFQRAHS